MDEPAVYTRGAPDYALAHEPHFFIECDRPVIVLVNIEFDPEKAGLLRGSQCRLDELSSKTLAAIGRKDPHSELAAMGVRREEMPVDVAPADDLVLRDSNELRIAFCNHAHHEGARIR